MIKPTKLLSIALVAIMALTVVSSAGALAVQARITEYIENPSSVQIADALDADPAWGWAFEGTGAIPQQCWIVADSGYWKDAADKDHLSFEVDADDTPAQVEVTATGVVGPGALTFNWYLSSMGDVSGDECKIQLFIDDWATPIASAPFGGGERTSATVAIPSGAHTLTWRVSAIPNSEHPSVMTYGELDWLRWTPRGAHLNGSPLLEYTVFGIDGTQSGEGSGKLSVNIKSDKFVFSGQHGVPGTRYDLYYVVGTDQEKLATGVANADGSVVIKGTGQLPASVDWSTITGVVIKKPPKAVITVTESKDNGDGYWYWELEAGSVGEVTKGYWSIYADGALLTVYSTADHPILTANVHTERLNQVTLTVEGPTGTATTPLVTLDKNTGAPAEGTVITSL